MKALVISDIHDHIENLIKVLSHPAARQCETLYCCGDLCAPFVINVLHEAWKQPAHIVFGNNDGDRFLISAKVNDANSQRPDNSKIQLHGEYLFKDTCMDVTGHKVEHHIAMTHYPEIAENLPNPQVQKIIFYGHSHVPVIRYSGRSLLVNPGSVMGYIPSQKKYSDPSFAVVDLSDCKAELFRLE